MENSPEVNRSDVGSSDVPLSSSSQCQMAWTHGTETYWGGRGAVCLLAFDLRGGPWDLPSCMSTLYVPEEENTRCPTSQCRVVDNSAC